MLLVLLTAGAGTGAWFLLGLGRGQTLWSLPYSGGSPDRQNYLSTWFTDKAVVRAQTDGISALDPASGRRLWGTPVPGEGTVVCASSSVASEGVAVLAFGETGSCSTVFALDLATGEVLWDMPVETLDEPPSLAVSGKAVVVNDKQAYLLADGSEAWAAKELPTDDGCTTGTFTGGAQLVRSYGCATKVDEFGAPSALRYTVSEIDPATGKARWEYVAKREDTSPDPLESHGEVLSTSPVVAREATGAYRILSDGGKPRGLVGIEGGRKLGQDAAFLGGSPSPAVAAHEGTLVVEQRHKNDEAVDGYDMDSGDKLWSTGPSSDVRYDLVQGAEEGLIATKEANGTFDLGDTDPFSLVAFDPETGDEDEMQDFDGVGDTLGVWNAAYLHEGGLFLASVSNKGSIGALEDIGALGEDHDSSLVAFEL
ncbi:PQQ-binding-like beta-propeller repeat protein [Streptomyces sp. DSM 42041]|uniref:PQQ-binding-like beta-propeller repeat protein n=1 Tax=Streptomyces hazeniae TaxID=3075538 RepID=A0ABU2NRH2_9ACTN|nr:PQQ-binding-like beta-propeller repeat protein [Streptomyces sp. DSM 42041]MDT0378833.1 PQQ-binding-like beta-propeller repeat protein [Streptomyces sp. DSM 42041]